MPKLDAVKINSLTHANRKAGEDVVSQVIIKITCDALMNEKAIQTWTKHMVRNETLVIDVNAKQTKADV